MRQGSFSGVWELRSHCPRFGASNSDCLRSRATLGFDLYQNCSQAARLLHPFMLLSPHRSPVVQWTTTSSFPTKRATLVFFFPEILLTLRIGYWSLRLYMSHSSICHLFLVSTDWTWPWPFCPLVWENFGHCFYLPRCGRKSLISISVEGLSLLLFPVGLFLLSPPWP